MAAATVQLGGPSVDTDTAGVTSAVVEAASGVAANAAAQPSTEAGSPPPPAPVASPSRSPEASIHPPASPDDAASSSDAAGAAVDGSAPFQLQHALHALDLCDTDDDTATSAAALDQHEAAAWERARQKVWQLHPPRRACGMARGNPVRATCILIAASDWFNAATFVAILVNAVLILANDPAAPGAGTGAPARNLWDTQALLYLNCIFSFELVIKVLAAGLYGSPEAYLSKPWNWLDAGLLALGWAAGVSPVAQQLAALRILRILRGVTIFTGPRIVLTASLRSMRALGGVCSIALLSVAAFALIGVSLWRGVLAGNCTYIDPSSGSLTLVPGANPCALPCQVGTGCVPAFGDACEPVLLPGANGSAISVATTCSATKNPDWGQTSFDNIGYAMLTSFVFITTEGWTSVVYTLWHTWGQRWLISLLSVTHVILTAWVVLELCLAVIGDEYLRVFQEERAQRDSLSSLVRSSRRRVDDRQALEARPTMMHALTSTLLLGLQQRRSTDRRRPIVQLPASAGGGQTGSATLSAASPAPAACRLSCCSPLRTRVLIRRLFGALLVDVMSQISTTQAGLRSRLLAWWKSAVPPVPAPVASACRRMEENPLFGGAAIALILVNGVSLGCEYEGMPRDYRQHLAIVNVTCVAAFTLELSIRILSRGLRAYLSKPFHVFDTIIVLLSLADVASDASLLAYSQTGAIVFRIARVIRLFRLARSWRSLQAALKDLLRALPQAVNTVIVLLCLELSAAAVGMQMFGGDRYAAAVDAGILQSMPRLHYNDLWTAFVAVFDVIDNENWNDQLHMHMAVFGPSAAIFFVVIILIGNYVFLNIMIAALVGAFEQQQQEQLLGLSDGAAPAASSSPGTLPWLLDYTKSMLLLRSRVSVSNESSAAPSPPQHRDPSNDSTSASTQDASASTACTNALPATVTIKVRARGHIPEVVASLPSPTPRTSRAGSDASGQREIRVDANGGVRINVVMVAAGGRRQMTKSSLSRSLSAQRMIELDASPVMAQTLAQSRESTNSLEEEVSAAADAEDDLRSTCIILAAACMQRTIAHTMLLTRQLRLWCAHAVENPWFERGVMATILLSCLNLALDEPTLQHCASAACSATNSYLKFADYAIAAIFTAEMVVQLLARGLWTPEVGYFRDWWRLLDFAMVIVSLLSIGVASTSVRSLRSIRAWRALRPLRFAARLEALRLVIGAVVASIPRVANVTLIIVVFVYMFAVAGMQSFQGTFNVCNDASMTTQQACTGSFILKGERCSLLPTDSDANSCTASAAGVPFPRLWAPQDANFDNIGAAMLTVFELATGENWPVLMTYAQDGTTSGPVTNSHPAAMLYYVLAEMIINQFLIELFASSIITMYTNMRSTMGDASLLTPSQREWVSNMRVIMRTRPKIHAQSAVYHIAWVDAAAAQLFSVITSPTFAALSQACVLLHMISLATMNVRVNIRWVAAYSAIDAVFAALFAAEVCVKLFARGWTPFIHSIANIFDALVSLLAVASVCTTYVAPASIAAAVLRVAPVVRIFRLALTTHSQRSLLSALTTRIPVFLNILGLLALDVFVFAVIGMNIFGGTRTSALGAYTSDASFDNFGTSLFTLLRCATGENFNMIMHDLAIAPPYCTASGPEANCGNPLAITAVYWTSFYAVTGWLLVAMLTAALVDAFEDVSDADSALGVGLFRLTHARAAQYTAAWVAACDEHARNRLLLPLTRVVPVIAALPPPMGCRQDNNDETAAVAAAKRLLYSLPLVPNELGELHFHTVLHALVERACALPPLGAVVGRITTGVTASDDVYTLVQMRMVRQLQRRWRARRARVQSAPRATSGATLTVMEGAASDDEQVNQVVTADDASPRASPHAIEKAETGSDDCTAEADYA